MHKNVVVSLAFAVTLVFVPSLALTAPADARAETIGALLLRLQQDSAVPLIQHCVTKIPRLKPSLDAEYLGFRKRFQKATAPLRASIATNDELSRPATRELIKQFEGMDAETLAQIQTLDPQTYCPRLKQNLSSATVETIRKNMESAFAQYTAMARQSR
jgi:hypothetical protein